MNRHSAPPAAATSGGTHFARAAQLIRYHTLHRCKTARQSDEILRFCITLIEPLMGEAVSFERAQWVWHNGSIVPWADAAVHVSAPSVPYGAGLCEGIRSYQAAQGPAVFRLKAHLNRFYASAAHYQIQIPYSPTD